MRDGDGGRPGALRGAGVGPREVSGRKAERDVEGTGTMRKRKRARIASIFLLGIAGCGGAGSASVAREGAPVVELGSEDVAVVRRGDLSTGVVLTGSLLPYRIVEVKAQVPGVVSAVRVDRGTRVRRGQVLATIDADGIRMQAAAAQANLALAAQRLESARALHEAGAMSDIDFRGVQAAYEAARAQAAAAAEQAVRTTIVAPIDGVVSGREVEDGEAVVPGQELFTVVNSDTLELAGQVPVEDGARIRPGMEVVFTLAADPGREFRGAVDRVEPVADLQTRQVGLYVRLPNPGGRLVAGQFATGRIVGERLTGVLLVPEGAVRGSGGEAYVLAIQNGQVVRRPVAVGARDRLAGTVAVLSGLAEGEQVLAVPSGTLAPGTRVRIRRGQAAPAAGKDGR